MDIILQRAVQYSSRNEKILKAIEEHAECVHALSRLLAEMIKEPNYSMKTPTLGALDVVAEEMADAEIMNDQLFIIYPQLANLKNEWRIKKIKKLENSLPIEDNALPF